MTHRADVGGRDTRDFQKILDQAGALIDPDTRLPLDPFRCHGAVDICQFDWILSGKFADILSEITKEHGDQSISLVVLDPDPQLYYYENYGTFPCFSLGVDELSVVSFWDGIAREPNDDPTGAIVFTANVVAIVGSSGRWAVWASREWDLTLIASAAPIRPWRDVGTLFVGAEEALRSFTEPDFKTPLSKEDREVFLEMVLSRGEAS